MFRGLKRNVSFLWESLTALGRSGPRAPDAQSAALIYAFDDTLGWGRMFRKAAREAGYRAHLFRWAFQVPRKGYVVSFMRMRTTHPERTICKRLAEQLGAMPNVLMIPSLRECRLYDDKVLQTEAFSGWLPPSWVLRSPDEARAVLRQVGTPFVSKSSEGASADNVRLIRTEAEALGEVTAAFSSQGLQCPRGQSQRGYLLWQAFMPGNTHDWRVVSIGRRYFYIMKRYNREDVPFASGSKRVEVVRALDPQSRSVLDFAAAFVGATGLTCTALDIVRAPDGRWMLLEASCAWGGIGGDRPFLERIDGEWRWTGETDGRLFRLILEAFEQGLFSS